MRDRKFYGFTDPANHSLASFHYVRTFKYGAALFKEDGTTGQDYLAASSAYLSADRRSVFLGVLNMKPVQQLRIGWSLATADGAALEDNGYTTIYHLAKFDPKAEGFGDLTVDVTPRIATKQNTEALRSAGGP